VIDYQYDDSLPDKVFTVKEIIKACRHHKDILVKSEHYQTVVSENRRKNILYGQIIQNIYSVANEVADSEGNVVKQLKAGRDIRFNYDDARILQVELAGFTPAEKSSVRDIVKSDNKVNIKV
jgi:hypothetical protein